MRVSAAMLLALGTLVDIGNASWGIECFDNLVTFGDRYGTIFKDHKAATYHAIVTPMRVGWDGIFNMAQLHHQEPHSLLQIAPQVVE